MGEVSKIKRARRTAAEHTGLPFDKSKLTLTDLMWVSLIVWAGNERCLLFGKHVFVFVVLFGVWFLNVFWFVFGVFGVRCPGTVLLCLVFGSGVFV